MAERIALITGSSSGIGKAAALALNAAGWTVCVTARRKDALDITVEEMSDSQRGLAIPADLSKPEDVKRVFETIKQKFGMSSNPKS
jgi:NAD(P)-dependent dehydrogenase (short-subunit alcohol dehydrogenase family)